ncbi:MAG: hypothetical protein HFF49_14710 [Lawsonibacter sp.]|nr:hypothetical protein [Lawsonibacter sp.]
MPDWAVTGEETRAAPPEGKKDSRLDTATARAELTIRDESQGEAFSGGGRQIEDGSWMLCLENGLLERHEKWGEESVP